MEKVLPKRKNPRLKGFDYSSPNYYFITICTFEKKCIFWENGSLNLWGKIAVEGIENIPKHFPMAEVNHYVVMPNHIHMILVLKEGSSSLSHIVGSYKAYISKKIHQEKLWQRSFHDHIIRNQKSYEKIWNYVENNQLKWEEDCFYSNLI